MAREPAHIKGIYPACPTDPISDIRDMFLKRPGTSTELPCSPKRPGSGSRSLMKQLRTETELIACGLAALGLQPTASRLAIVGDNRPEWAVSYLAAACTGIICVPIDRDLKETEVYNILSLSGAQA